MKKLIFLIGASLLFFTGCTHLGNISSKFSNTTIEKTTGEILGRPEEHPKYHWIKKTEYGSEYYVTIATGYKYTATYDDLGFRILLNDPYTETFFTIPSHPIFKRIGNKVFNILMLDGKLLETTNPSFFIEMFYKSTGENLFDIINNNHLSTGCTIYNPYSDSNYKNDLPLLSGIDKNNFFDITQLDSKIGDQNICKPDNKNPDIPFGVSYFQSIYHQDRYYKLSYPAACAPTCGMFTSIEFF